MGDDGCHISGTHSRSEASDLLVGQGGGVPLALVLNEDLEALAPPIGGGRDRLFQPTGDGEVGTEAWTAGRAKIAGRVIDDRTSLNSSVDNRLHAVLVFGNQTYFAFEKNNFDPLTRFAGQVFYSVPLRGLSGLRRGLRRRLFDNRRSGRRFVERRLIEARTARAEGVRWNQGIVDSSHKKSDRSRSRRVEYCGFFEEAADRVSRVPEARLTVTWVVVRLSWCDGV